jgi:hypothetical protein
MRIVNLNEQLQDFRDELIGHFRGRRLIPVIGSGFTRESISKNGKVPSGLDMKIFMSEKLLEKFPNDEEKLKTMKFSKVASLYEKHVNGSIKHRYLEDNFTYVKLDDIKSKFLSIGWPYLYTLNIDDAIESNSKEFEVILPNVELNEEYIDGKKCVFKLHGDARDVLKYKPSNKYIFSESQYLSSLKTNVHLLNSLRDDLISKNIIYIGCSLEDETDILSSIIEIADSKTNIRKNTYFVTHKVPNDIEISQLEDFAITCIIVVDDYKYFYQELIYLYLESTKLKEEGIDNYLNLNLIPVNNLNFSDNVNYLFDTKVTLNKVDNKIINVPSFFIERDLSKMVLSNLKNSSLQIIYGHRISGKTYVLYNVLRNINDRDVYYFPSTINLDFTTVQNLISKSKVVLIFDTNTLDDIQIRYITSHINYLRENDSQIVLAVNSSDKDIINILSSVSKNELNIMALDNKLSFTEIKKINDELSILSIPIFDKNKTLLDNIISVENVLPLQDGKLKSRPIISPSKELLIVLIILAVKETLPTIDLVRFELIKEIGQIYSDLEPLIQYEYTSIFEKNAHSGSKLIPNAKYWILKTLGDYAKNSKNHEYVAEAYLYIASRLKGNLNHQRFSKEISRYIKFDVINDIFPKSEHGSVALISKIYDALQTVLSSEPQYFHQRAKSKLWYYRHDDNELRDALRFAKTAEHNLNIQRYSDDYKRTSLSHIKFTVSTILGRLLVLNGFRDQLLAKETIEAYNDALKEKENEQYLIYSLNKSKNYNKREAADLKRIIEHYSINGGQLEKDIKDKFGILVNLLNQLTVKERGDFAYVRKDIRS